MFRASTFHHQEVSCIYVANDTSKITVSDSRQSSDSHKKCHLPHKYTLPPDDGLLMPETCRGTLIP
jgi:hypothetical protein